MTLPEVLITISLMGLLSAVIAGAIIVTLRQADNTEGRVNVARSETSIDTWLPADLSSTDVNATGFAPTYTSALAAGDKDDEGGAVDRNPDAVPCTTTCNGIDLSGTNALQLTWQTSVAGQPTPIVTRVQYQYIQGAGGDWQLRRIECVGGSPCTVVTILFDLAAPPESFDPKADRPSWVLDVSVPEVAAGLELDDNARRIVVTIDGGGDADGVGGGVNSISLTAGGRVTEEIDADDFTVPSFVRAKSRCGGPITLVVDGSGSIAATDMDNVIKPGVEEFIDAFRGTPTRIQVVHFDNSAQAIGPNNADTTVNGGWHRYVDMTNETDVDALLSAVSTDLTRGGATNWEEAFFRTFRESNGDVAQAMPTRVVFFTDGVPTSGRHTEMESRSLDTREGDLVHFNAGQYDYTVGWNDPAVGNYGIRYDQESWDRADVLLDLHRNVDLVFVGVGSGLTSNRDWVHNPAVYQDPSEPPSAAVTKTGAEILSYLLANGPSGHVTAQSEVQDGQLVYTNADTADFYLQSSFDADAFGSAMRAAALKDCGGTITVQTRHADTGEAIEDEVVYENPTYRDEADVPIPGIEPRFVTTSSNFRTGTFDFELSDAANFFNVDVVPSELQTLDGYEMTGWSCRSGASTKAFESIPIANSPGGFTGITVELRADEAISCIMNVRPA